MEKTERADQLVNIIGDLLAMAQAAVRNGEFVLASHLQNGADAALMRLAGIDHQLAEGWSEVYRCNVADRQLTTDELRQLAASRYVTPSLSTTLRTAAEMLS